MVFFGDCLVIFWCFLVICWCFLVFLVFIFCLLDPARWVDLPKPRGRVGGQPVGGTAVLVPRCVLHAPGDPNLLKISSVPPRTGEVRPFEPE